MSQDIQQVSKSQTKLKRILFILISVLLGLLVYNSFHLFNYLFYLDPELERWILLYLLIFSSGFITSLLPSKIVDVSIAGLCFSFLFYLEINLEAVFYYKSLGLLPELWEPRLLASTLVFVPIILGGVALGYGVKLLIKLLIKSLKKNKFS